MHSLLLCALSALPGQVPLDEFRRPSPFEGWLVQGLVGLNELEISEIDFDPASVDFDDSEDATLPLLGGAFQLPLAGQRLRLGMEGGFTFGWEGDITTVIISNGVTVISGENDLFLCDVFVGAYADLLLGERARLYAGLGPLMQYGSIDIEWQDPVDGVDTLSEDGFGGGVYARVGFEVRLPSGMLVGLGARAVEGELDLSGPIDEVDLEGMQVFLSVTRPP